MIASSLWRKNFNNILLMEGPQGNRFDWGDFEKI